MTIKREDERSGRLLVHARHHATTKREGSTHGWFLQEVSVIKRSHHDHRGMMRTKRRRRRREH